MANVSSAVEIETRTGRVLSIALQGVADDQSVNVGTLLITKEKAIDEIIRRGSHVSHPTPIGTSIVARNPVAVHSCRSCRGAVALQNSSGTMSEMAPFPTTAPTLGTAAV
jgi:hypothetical protein